MSLLSPALKAFSLFAIASGTGSVVFGSEVVTMLSGHPFPKIDSPATTFADSQLRFLGGMFVGYGVMLWWATNDFKGRRTPLAILGAIMVLSGIGRAISGWKHGFGPTGVSAATAIEILAPVGIWLFGGW